MKRTDAKVVHTCLTIKQWFNNKITIPPYQRGLVWTDQQRKDLIDSIINGYDIPKIYFKKYTDDKKGERFHVIDGQQRIDAIVRFMNNEYSLDRDSDFSEDPSIEIAGKKYNDLHSRVQDIINSFELNCVTCENYTEDDEKELFLRLQGGTSLSAPEKRRSLRGNVPQIISKLSNHKLFTELNSKNNRSLLDREDKRFWHEDIVAKVMLDLENNKISQVSAKNLRDMYERNKNLSEDEDLVKNLEDIFEFFYQIFKKQKPKFSQVDFRRLAWIQHTMAKQLNLKKYKDKFAQSYLDFDQERGAVLARVKEDTTGQAGSEYHTSKFIEYTEKARAYDIAGQESMDDFLRSYIHNKIPDMVPVSEKRFFTLNQKKALLFRSSNKCEECNKKINIEEMQADHKIRYSDGGPTSIDNGQALCQACHENKTKLENSSQKNI
tara:strand:- start:80 stop:1387 length:1308 start_codon:yes stop_codon:yes gene_type:complete